MTEWKDLIEEQPRQGQRVLVEMLDRIVRITSYDRYRWSHWFIRRWKPIPQDQYVNPDA